MVKKLCTLQVLSLTFCGLVYAAEPEQALPQPVVQGVQPLKRQSGAVSMPPQKRVRTGCDTQTHPSIAPQQLAQVIQPPMQQQGPVFLPPLERQRQGENSEKLHEKDLRSQHVVPEIRPSDQAQLPVQASQESQISSAEAALLLAAADMQAQGAVVDMQPQQEHRHEEPVAPQAVVPQAQDLQTKIYFNEQIEPIIRDLMVKEEGKIYAAYYEANSAQLLRWWAGRRYIQEFEKARRDGNIDGIFRADQYKTSPKEDLLIVDHKSVVERGDRRGLEDLAASGVQVFVRTKPRQPTNQYQTMHFKFLVFFHKDRPDLGKLAITGSFNMTNQAGKYNWEDIAVLRDPETVAKYVAQHGELRQYCEPLSSIVK
jgi:hypothetical protein